MSTKSAYKSPTRVPFQARHKVIVVTVVILAIAWLAWNFLYTRMAATTPIGGKAPVISPTETVR